MKAFRVHKYGEAAKFIEDEVNKPSAKQGHVVIEVKASSLNPIDLGFLTNVGLECHCQKDHQEPSASLAFLLPNNYH